MASPPIPALPRALADEGGWVSLLVGLVVPAVVLCTLGALDIGRIAALRDSLQAAAETGAREIVRGLPESAVTARIRASLKAEAAGLGQWDGLSVIVSQADADIAEVEVRAPFAPLLAVGAAPLVGAQAQARFFCVPPANRWVPVTEACPDGQSGDVSYEQEEEGYCPAPTGTPSWRATQNRQNVVKTCAAS